MSIDLLQEKIRKLKNPTVAGIDPRLEYIPRHIMAKHLGEKGETPEAAADAVREFSFGLIDALSGVVPALKPQSAFFERLGPCGAAALRDVIRCARERDMYVICDAKRGDIGSTAEAYSDAYLGSVMIGETEYVPYGCDGLTVNAYTGSDGLKPFAEACKRLGKSVFVLVKTSNPSSAELQDLICGDRSLSLAVGELVERLSAGTEGRFGYGCVGAVAGATHPAALAQLRKKLPGTFFLVPGYGAQGGRAEDVSYAFDALGRGAVVSASRAIMCAWQSGGDGRDYAQAAKRAALEMRGEILKYVTIV